MQIAIGDRVRITYTIRFEDGELIGESESPVEFTVGADDSLRVLSTVVQEMSIGEVRRIRIPPEDTDGRHDSTLTWTARPEKIPEESQVGDELSRTLNGAEQTVWVSQLTPESVLLDGNHPLTGQTLELEIHLLARVRGSDDAPNQLA